MLNVNSNNDDPFINRPQLQPSTPPSQSVQNQSSRPAKQFTLTTSPTLFTEAQLQSVAQPTHSSSYQLNPPPSDFQLIDRSSTSPTNAKDSDLRHKIISLQKADAFLDSLGDSLRNNSTKSISSSNTRVATRESNSQHSVSPKKKATMTSDGDTIMSSLHDNNNNNNNNNSYVAMPSIFTKQAALEAISEGRRVYVGNLDITTSVNNLAYMFPDCEKDSAVLVPETNGRGVFLSYSTAEHARVVVACLDGQRDRYQGSKNWTAQIVHPDYIQNNNAKAKASCEEGRRLYIQNIHPATTEIDLANFVRDYETEMISIPCDGSNVPMGYALISMLSAADARNALAKLNNTMLLENKVYFSLSYKPPGQVPSQEVASRVERSPLRLENIAKAAELKRQLEIARAQRSIANLSTSLDSIIAPSAIPTGPRSINNLSVRGHSNMMLQVLQANCDICPGKHKTFSPECTFKQDIYAVAAKLDQKLGGIYKGPPVFQNFTDLLKYDAHARPTEPLIRWPFPKKLARDMSDEQFSLILLDVLSYTLPANFSDTTTDVRPVADIKKSVVKLEPLITDRRISANFASMRPVASNVSIAPTKAPQQTPSQAPSLAESQVVPVGTTLICPECPRNVARRFIHETAMLQHLVSAHPITLKDKWFRRGSNGRLYCNFCPSGMNSERSSFTEPPHLAQHVASRHPIETGFLKAPLASLKRRQEEPLNFDSPKRPRITNREIRTAVSHSPMVRDVSKARPLLCPPRERQRSRSPILQRSQVHLSPSNETRRQEWRGERDSSRQDDEIRRKEWLRERDTNNYEYVEDARKSSERRVQSALTQPHRVENDKYRPDRIERPEERSERVEQSGRPKRPEPSLAGRFFQDSIGGSYYNGTGIRPTELQLKPFASHYSPQPLKTKVNRVKEEEPTSKRSSASAGLSSVPSMPKSMLPPRASTFGRAQMDGSVSKEKEKLDVYDDAYCQPRAMKNVLRQGDGRLKKDWESEEEGQL